MDAATSDGTNLHHTVRKPNQSANGAPRDAVRRHNQGVLYSQNVHTVSRYTHICNLINAPKYSTAFLTPILTKPKTAQRNSVQIFRTKFHPNRSKFYAVHAEIH
jgi:hypothetical protein